jgi:Tol biopolymer transport system component
MAVAASIGIAGLKTGALVNPAAYIPTQCYTKTKGANGDVHNTCYTCHTRGLRPEFTNDSDFQSEYDFAAAAAKNAWSNLLKNRSGQTARLDDSRILEYIRRSNYFDDRGKIVLGEALRQPPSAWDADGDGRWSGYIPDCCYNFDAEGFDRDPSGGYTGWRAYAFYPFPSTHWPTNGSFADALIRLPEVFRTQNRQFDILAYRTNLAILEALIKRRNVTIPETNEAAFGVDLDKDGRLGQATRITFDWSPLEGRTMTYVGDARLMQHQDRLHLAAGLFPEGTEFLSTLRYLDISAESRIQPAPRMKEVRYLRKRKWLNYAELETLAMNEIKEKNDFPDRLRLPVGDLERGVSNGKGWVAQGFIEDAGGTLRPQSVEETFYCTGCHGGIGATTDSVFSFGRKLDPTALQGGWWHWSQRGIEGLNEPKVEFQKAGVQYEYCFYLSYAGAGDEFRANAEVLEKFFDVRGVLRQEMAEKLHEDISVLLLPSPQRATALNKAYKAIVEEQSFVQGRDTLVGSPVNLHAEIKPEDRMTTVADPVILAEPPHHFTGAAGLSYGTAAPKEPFEKAVSGGGMAGPNGERYSVSWTGQIDESTYAVSRPGFYFPFPARHTLPARIIVPNAGNASCYACHRLTSPMPPRDPQVKIPVPLPPAAARDAGLIRLTQDPGVDMDGVWSPDGNWIAWVSNRRQGFQIWLMKKDGSQPRQLTSGPSIHGWPRWSPDGKKLVCWGYDAKSGFSAIRVCSFDGGQPINLVESKESLDRPVWSPDGKYIAYAAQTKGNWDIWVASPESGRRFRLTYDAQMETNPLWSPDGSVIAFKAAPNKEYNLTIENFILVKDGFEAPTYRPWDGIKSIQMSDWSPDGKKIAYTAEMITHASGEDRVSYLSVVNEVSMSGSRIAGRPVVLSGGMTLGDRGPVFSPTGDRVCFWAWDRAYRATLWVANADGSGLKRLTSDGMDMVPHWSPDGRSILFESSRSGNMDIWTVAVD